MKKSLLLTGVLTATLLGLGMALAQQEPGPGGQETSAVGVTPDPTTAGIYDRGLRHYRQRNFREALTEFNQVLESEPDRPEVLYLIGYCHLMLRQFEPSVEFFGKAFAKDPHFDPRTIYGSRPNS